MAYEAVIENDTLTQNNLKTPISLHFYSVLPVASEYDFYYTRTKPIDEIDCNFFSNLTTLWIGL